MGFAAILFVFLGLIALIYLEDLLLYLTEQKRLGFLIILIISLLLLVGIYQLIIAFGGVLHPFANPIRSLLSLSLIAFFVAGRMLRLWPQISLITLRKFLQAVFMGLIFLVLIGWALSFSTQWAGQRLFKEALGFLPLFAMAMFPYTRFIYRSLRKEGANSQ